MNQRILVVDDSPFIHELVRDILSDAGYDVERAMNGHEAMVSIGQNPPDLVLLDIIMPEMSGYQVCRLIRSDKRLMNLPVVMMTAKDTQKDRFWGLEVGADAYITKPIEQDELLSTISELLEEFRAPVTPVSEAELTTEVLKDRADDILERKLLELTIINETGKLYSFMDRPTVLLQNALKLISQVINYDLGAVILVFPGADEKIFAVRYRNHPMKVSKKEMLKMGADLIASERGSKSSEVQNLNSVMIEESEIEDGPSRKPSRAKLEVVLRSSRGVLGSVMLFSSRKNFFIKDDKVLVEMIGVQLSILLDNVWLLQERGDQLSAVELEKNRMEAILRNMGEGVIATDWPYKVIHTNPQARKLLGLGNDDMVGQHLFDHISRKSFGILEDQAIGEENPIWNIRFSSKTEELPLVASVAVVDDEEEKTLGLILLLRDVTEERELDKMKNRFLENVSTHLNSPLTSLRGFSDLLREEVYDAATPRQREYMEMIDSETGKLAEILDDLMSLSRIELADYKFDPVSFPVSEALLTTMVNYQSAAQARGITLKTDIDDNLPQIYADRESVIDIVNRLLSNAIKFSPDKTGIIIGARSSRDVKDDEFLEVFVSDSGPGVPPDKKDVIFEQYQQLNRFMEDRSDGIGLGLPICKRLAEMNGGSISIDASGERGSTFVLKLPIAESA